MSNQNQISLDQEIARKLDTGMRSGEAIELPFPVFYAWAHNGQASYKSQGGAMYFGGWAAKVEDVQTVAESQGLSVPADWKQFTNAGRDGDEFEIYTTRSVLVAPIAKRISWLLEGHRQSGYVEGARRHLQVLAYLAERKGENGKAQIIPWGPLVLTAKGYQARNLLDAFRSWDKAISAVRRKVAPGVPSWCFYMALGTFGKERQAQNVGKPGAQSPITPLSCYVPADLTPERFATLFVGNETAAIMADLQDQAQDWLKAWAQPATEADPNADDFNYGLQPDEEIPF